MVSTRNNFNMESRKKIEILSNTDTYRRLQYSLKLALRMVNGRLEDLKI